MMILLIKGAAEGGDGKIRNIEVRSKKAHI
jgi:hypothetical protein